MRRTKDNMREAADMDSDPEVWRHGVGQSPLTDDSFAPGHSDPSHLGTQTDGEDELADDPTQRGYFGESARIGRFAVLRTLGEGGMGVVYSAYDEELDRRVALKLLRPGRDNSPRNQARMQREARAMAKLSHPNVVQVYEVGRFEEQVFLAMEFVQGRTLGAWLKAEPRGWQEVLQILVQAGRGLHAAHESGIIHGDFKPDNILIDAEERVRVLDFGLSRRTEPASASLKGAAASGEAGRSLQGAAASGEAGRSLQSAPIPAPIPAPVPTPAPPHRDADELRSNAKIAGTPAYMAPEQHRHVQANQRTDQFSFCVTLFTALYGIHPFAGGSLLELIIKLTDGKINPVPAGSTVPAVVHSAVVRGLLVDPEQRWPSLADLLAELEAILARFRDPELDLSVARRQRVLLAMIIAVSILAMSFVVILGSPAEDMLPSAETNALAGAAINALLLVVVFSFRRNLLQNRINRQLTAWLVVSSLAMLADRTIALVLELPVSATMALDLLLLGSIAAMSAIIVEKWIAWPATLLLTGALMATILPGVSSVILAIAIVGVFCLAVLFWSRRPGPPRA
ncbi:MAG: protein kinase [Nannocystis sp.]|nr:serine/threonine-protein kinase [Nannocystis sp.]MBA3545963.1 protein kinase [Nannocystis sp.]